LRDRLGRRFRIVLGAALRIEEQERELLLSDVVAGRLPPRRSGAAQICGEYGCRG
jgi:hypothetical protein